MACFTKEKPFVVTEQQVKLKWSGAGLKCALCGHKFVAGDTARWVYANSTPGAGCGNFFTCPACDGPDVLTRGIASFNQATELAKRWGIYGPDWL